MLTERQVKALVIMSQEDAPPRGWVAREVGISAESLDRLYRRYGRVHVKQEYAGYLSPPPPPQRKKKRIVRPTHAVVYGLRCPIDKTIRYVGSTLRLNMRRSGHFCGAVNNAVAQWMSRLYHLGMEPELVILERVPAEEQYLREMFWIDSLTADGVKLLNVIRGNKVLQRR